MIKCCICGNKFEGFGNSPYGAEDVVKRSFSPSERCCDDCNKNYVIPMKDTKSKKRI